MVSTSQPVRAIQPTMGMMKIRPWTTILLNHPGSWKGHAKLSPTLVTAGSVMPNQPPVKPARRLHGPRSKLGSDQLCEHTLTRAGGLNKEHAELRRKDDQGLLTAFSGPT